MLRSPYLTHCHQLQAQTLSIEGADSVSFYPDLPFYSQSSDMVLRSSTSKEVSVH